MAFNPITDLRLNSDDKIEDAPAVNIEVELLPLLRRTASKTKQVANVIKSNNSLLKSDLERITTLRRRLQRVIPVIPRMVGTAGAIFGQQIDREPPSGFPFLAPIIGGGRPPRPPVIEETKKETEIKKEKELEIEIEIDKKNVLVKVRDLIKELIKLGLFERARQLAEENGILSEFPELQTKKDNQEENLKTLKLEDVVKIVLEKQKELDKAIPLSVNVDGSSFTINTNQQLEKAERGVNGTIIDTNIPKYEFQRVLVNGFLENRMVNIQNEPPSAFVYLLAEDFLKQAKETNQVQEGMTEAGYIIRAFPSGQIYISSPGFRIEGAKNIANNKGLQFLNFAAAVFDLYPGNFKSKNLSKTQKTQRIIKTNKSILTTKGKINYSNFNQRTRIRIKNLNKNKFFDIKTRKRLEELLNKKFAKDELLRRINQDKDVAKVISDLDAHLRIISKALRTGEVKDVSAEDFRRAVNVFGDVMVDMLEEGGMTKKELDSILRDLRTLNTFDGSTIFEGDSNKPIKNDALVEKMNRIFNFSQDYPNYQPAGGGDKDLSSLRIDTGNDTLIVLLDSDSPIPSFG